MDKGLRLTRGAARIPRSTGLRFATHPLSVLNMKISERIEKMECYQRQRREGRFGRTQGWVIDHQDTPRHAPTLPGNCAKCRAGHRALTINVLQGLSPRRLFTYGSSEFNE